MTFWVRDDLQMQDLLTIIQPADLGLIGLREDLRGWSLGCKGLALRVQVLDKYKTCPTLTITKIPST